MNEEPKRIWRYGVEIERTEYIRADLVDRLVEALWICSEHNSLHHGERHNTVIQARAALKSLETNNE